MAFANFYWDSDSSQSLRPNGPTYSAVSSTYFRAVGMRILRGAPFETGSGAPKQVMLNEHLAARLWPRDEPIGKCIRFGARDADCYVVAGIVENARQGYVIEAPQSMYYLPLGNLPSARMSGTTLLVLAAPHVVPAVMAGVRTELQRAFPGASVGVTTLRAELEPEYRPWRLGATLFAAMAALALVIAIVGIYSTVAYDVTQRAHEFGVRIALGARTRHMMTHVVRGGVRVVAIGIAVGIVLALAAGKFLAALLYGIGPRDPGVLAATSAALIVVAVLAAAVPARRAARISPVVTMRGD
jgi:hypothetical protein